MSVVEDFAVLEDRVGAPIERESIRASSFGTLGTSWVVAVIAGSERETSRARSALPIGQLQIAPPAETGVSLLVQPGPYRGHRSPAAVSRAGSRGRTAKATMVLVTPQRTSFCGGASRSQCLRHQARREQWAERDLRRGRCFDRERAVGDAGI